MTTAITLPDQTDLKQLSLEQLCERFQHLRAMTCGAVAAMAAVVRAIEERGKDAAEIIPDVDHAFIDSLRSVAYGQCLPGIFSRFGHSPTKLRKLQTLPLPDQQMIADGGMVDLVVLDDEGKFTTRKADPLTMLRGQFAQVFAHGSIRREAEQILMLEEQRIERRHHRPKRVGDLEPDPERGGAVFKGKHGDFIPKADLQALLAALR